MGQLPGDFCLKFTAPVRDCSSYRGNLLSTVQPVGKQGHHDAGHDLRGCVQQELLHVDNLLYRRAVPRDVLAVLCNGCNILFETQRGHFRDYLKFQSNPHL